MFRAVFPASPIGRVLKNASTLGGGGLRWSAPKDFGQMFFPKPEQLFTKSEQFFTKSEQFFTKPLNVFTICRGIFCYKLCNACYKLSNTCYKLCNAYYKLCNKKSLIGAQKLSGRKEKITPIK